MESGEGKPKSQLVKKFSTFRGIIKRNKKALFMFLILKNMLRKINCEYILEEKTFWPGCRLKKKDLYAKKKLVNDKNYIIKRVFFFFIEIKPKTR